MARKVQFLKANPSIVLGFASLGEGSSSVGFYTTGLTEVKIKVAFKSRAPRIEAYARR